MHNDRFGLSDDEFWTAPRRTAMAVAQRLWGEGRDVTAIDAPRSVPIDKRTTLPVVVYRAGSYRDLWALSFADRALITAVDLEQNRVFAGPVVNEADVEPPAEPIDPDQAPKGDTTDSAVVDLREVVDLPWQPSTYVVTVILRDMVSNRVRVELGKSASTYHDDEVAKFLAAHKAEATPPHIHPVPGDPLPSYGAIDGSPAVPDAPGISFAADRVVVLDQSARCVLRGAFRLPARSHEIVKPERREASGQGTGTTPPPTAVVAITLLATGGDDATATLLRLDVPSWDPIDPANPIVTGHFALDLLSSSLLPHRAQTYFLYAFSGDAMVGPVPAALVSKEMLPSHRQ